MNRFRLAILGTVSAFTLLAAATASQAVSPPVMNLGLLRSGEQWKVGTVDANGLAYCAMVGKFDKQVVLAVARSPDGYGSIAVDFREKFFEPGSEYEVTLKPDGGKERTLQARASSPRSVVVQVGMDESFFKDLGAGGTLAMSMPTINASFALRQFSDSYKDLVSCASHVGGNSGSGEPTGKRIKDAARNSTTPIDEEAAKISGGTRVASADLRKSDKFSDMEAELDREAAAETKSSGRKLAELDTRKQDIQKQIDEEKSAAPETAEAAPAPAPELHHPARKLLASSQQTGSVTSVPTVADSAEAQAIEKQQLALSEQARRAEAEKKAAIIAQAAQRKQQEMAALEEKKSAVADSQVSAFTGKTAELDQKLASAEKTRDDIQTQLKQQPKNPDDSKALRAALVAMQGQVASLSRQKSEETDALTKKLAQTQSDYQTRVAALETERDGLKQKLAAAQAANIQPAAGVSEAQAKLAASEQEKGELSARLAALDRQNKLMQASLGGKEKEISSGQGSAKELASVRAQMASLQKEHETEVAGLRQKLDAQTAQFAALKKDSAAVRVADAGVAAQLTQSQSLVERLKQQIRDFQSAHSTAKTDAPRIAALEQQLSEVTAARQAEADRAARAQAELDAAHQQIAALTETLGATKTAAAPAVAMPQRKPDIVESLPPVTQPLASIAPSAGTVIASNDAPVTSKSSGFVTDKPLFSDNGHSILPGTPSGYTRSAQPVPRNAAPEGYDRSPQQQASADNFPVPAVPAEPVDSAAISSVTPDSNGAGGNRAAAFLDKIMAYHHAGGEKIAAPEMKEAVPQPGIAAAEPASVPLPTLAAADKVAPPSVPAVKTATAAPEEASIEPAAGVPGKMIAPVITPPSTMSARAPAVAPAAPVVAAAPVTLETLLADAGLKKPVFASAAAGEPRQWTAGRLNGMMERTASSGAFETQVQSYIDRYREDCPGHLKASVGDARPVAAGTMATASISCDMPANAYRTSFVFLQDGASFTSILHTGVPADAEAVKNAGDDIAKRLSASGGLAADGAKSAEAAPEPELKFTNVTPVKTDVSYAAAEDDIPTQIVQ